MTSIRRSTGDSAARILHVARASAFVLLLSASVVAAGVPQAARAYDPRLDRQPPDEPAYAPAPAPAYPPAQAYPPPYPPGAPYGGSVAAQAMAQGAADARADTNGVLWMGAGCVIGVLGVVLGYVVEPSPPPSRLLGKSPEYVSAYAQAYSYTGKREQGGKALTGCLAGTAVVGVIYLVAIAAASSSSSTY